MKSVRPVLIALSLAVAMVLMMSVTSDAAMDASLSSAHARPGDWILLLSDDHNGTWDHHSLSAAGRQAIYLAPASGDDGAACTGQSVGRLEWRGNRGGVAFRVPNLPPGVYNVFIDVVDASPSCWGITGGLTIGSVAADNQAVAARWTVDSLARPSQQPPGRESNGLWLPIVGALVALAALSLFGLWKRQRRVDAKAIER
jgi:LPXTG-motif cell wall-anchored protein